MQIVDPQIDITDHLRGDYYGLIYDIYRNCSYIYDDDSIMAKLSPLWHKQRLQRFRQHERIFDELLTKLLPKSEDNLVDGDLLKQLIESKISLQRAMIKTKSFFTEDPTCESRIDPKVFSFAVNYLSINNNDLEKPSCSLNNNHQPEPKPSSKNSAVPKSIVKDTEDKKVLKDLEINHRCDSLSSSHVINRSFEARNEITSNNDGDICLIETINDKKTDEEKNGHSAKTISEELRTYSQTFNDDISTLISNIDTIMNEITFWNVIQKTIEFKALGIDNSKKLETIILRMLDVIIKEFASDKRITQWAMFIANLMDFAVPNVGINKFVNLVKFEALFLEICEEHFIKVIKNIDRDPFGKRILIGLSKIIAELFKLDALDGKLVLEYLNRFVPEDQTKESMIECFYLMIDKLGADSMLKLQVYSTANDNQSAQNDLNSLINRLKSILRNHGCKNYSNITLNFSKEIIERHNKNWLVLSGDHNTVYTASHFSSIRKNI